MSGHLRLWFYKKVMNFLCILFGHDPILGIDHPNDADIYKMHIQCQYCLKKFGDIEYSGMDLLVFGETHADGGVNVFFEDIKKVVGWRERRIINKIIKEQSCQTKRNTPGIIQRSSSSIGLQG